MIGADLTGSAATATGWEQVARGSTTVLALHRDDGQQPVPVQRMPRSELAILPRHHRVVERHRVAGVLSTTDNRGRDVAEDVAAAASVERYFLAVERADQSRGHARRSDFAAHRGWHDLTRKRRPPARVLICPRSTRPPRSSRRSRVGAGANDAMYPMRLGFLPRASPRTGQPSRRSCRTHSRGSRQAIAGS